MKFLGHSFVGQLNLNSAVAPLGEGNPSYSVIGIPKPWLTVYAGIAGISGPAAAGGVHSCLISLSLRKLMQTTPSV